MRLAPPLLAACLLAAPLGAEPDARLRDAIAAELAGQADSGRLAVLASELAGGLPSVTPPEPPVLAEVAPDVREGEVQVALTQLSILSGSNGHLALQLAQNGRTDVIYLMSGTARLADLAQASDLIRREGEVWHLQRPLVVWPEAALVLSAGEELEMDTAGGAFLLSFGTVRLDGASLRGDGGENPVVKTYRPFLLVTGRGNLRAEGAGFADLGFNGPTAFRGVAVLTTGLLQSSSAPVVTDSRFERVLSLAFEGADGLVLARNRLSGAGAVVIRDGRNLVLAENRISVTGAGAGLRLSGELDGVTLVANTIHGAGGNGIQVTGRAARLDLVGNVVTGNAGAGIAIGQADCVTVRGNIIADNRTSGLRMADSGRARVEDNAILSNGSAGIEVQDQSGLGPVLLSDNLLARNREGLRAAGLGEVTLSGNDLSDQMPRQFAGDFAPWLGPWLSAGQALVIPAALGTTPEAAVPCETE